MLGNLLIFFLQIYFRKIAMLLFRQTAKIRCRFRGIFPKKRDSDKINLSAGQSPYGTQQINGGYGLSKCNTIPDCVALILLLLFPHAFTR